MKGRKRRAVFYFGGFFLFFFTTPWPQGGVAMALEIESRAFVSQEKIPKQFTCDDRDISPDLSWSGAPAGTASFALICDDPDAPMVTWVHWVIYNIPAEARGLAEGVPRTGVLKDGSRQGINDSQEIGYSGPCPPPGRPHHYFFKLYALDSK